MLSLLYYQPTLHLRIFQHIYYIYQIRSVCIHIFRYSGYIGRKWNYSSEKLLFCYTILLYNIQIVSSLLFEFQEIE